MKNTENKYKGLTELERRQVITLAFRKKLVELTKNNPKRSKS